MQTPTPALPLAQAQARPRLACLNPGEPQPRRATDPGRGQVAGGPPSIGLNQRRRPASPAVPGGTASGSAARGAGIWQELPTWGYQADSASETYIETKYRGPYLPGVQREHHESAAGTHAEEKHTNLFPWRAHLRFLGWDPNDTRAIRVRRRHRNRDVRHGRLQLRSHGHIEHRDAHLHDRDWPACHPPPGIVLSSLNVGTEPR